MCIMKNIAAQGVTEVNNMKKSIKRVFWLTLCLFLLLIGSLLKTAFWDSDSIVTNSYNPRLNYDEEKIRRGEIKDINGAILAVSEPTESTFIRNYVYGAEAAHVTGYTGIGKTGLEAAENFQLIKLHNEIWQRIKNITTGSELHGNNIVSTIDIAVQQKANELLGKQKGAVVVMEPSTGRILAMASSPNFDPNTVVQNWDELRQAESSPLVNRAAHGLYPPGSTFKIVTALAAIKYFEGYQDFTYECTGEASFEGKVIHCFDEKAHGSVNLETALAESCNTYFAELGKKIGAQKLRETADSLYFNQSVPFMFSLSTSNVVLSSGASESELVETAIGQGRTTVTPLFMAMIASAIANDGILMKPYLVDHIEYYNGKKGKTYLPEKLSIIMSPGEAELLTQMMIGVVNNGTGKLAQLSNIQSAGKTGTAENETGEDHSWYIGFAPADQPKIAVAVVLENAGGKRSAAQVAGKIMNTVLNK